MHVIEIRWQRQLVATATSKKFCVHHTTGGFVINSTSSRRDVAIVFHAKHLHRSLWLALMRLTTYTDYSLRVLMYVAVRPDPMPTIAQITEGYGISKNHVMKVVSGLSQLGYLRTIQGKGGGLALARPADSIKVGEVVRATEPDLALMPCFEPLNEECAIYPSCVLRRVVREAREAFLGALDHYTLLDLTRNRAALRGLLASVADPSSGGRSKAGTRKLQGVSKDVGRKLK